MSRFFLLLCAFSTHAFISNAQAPKSFGFTYICNGKDSVTVDRVITESPAEKGGLKTGDLLQQVNGVSLLNLPFAEVTKRLASASDPSTFTLLRAGKYKQLIVAKAPPYTFNRICLSGNCINGKGVAIGKLSTNMLEGTFVDGELVNGSWYLNGKDLTNKGQLIRKGELSGDRFSGFFIDPNTQNGERWYEVRLHEYTKYQFAGGNNFNGVVKCYADPDGKKILWKGTFENKVLVDFFTQYFHDVDLEWSYQIYRNGNKFGHSLHQISTGKKLGDNLNYDERTHSWSGIFTVGGTTVVYLSNMTSYQQIDQQYKYGVQKNNTPATSNTGTYKPSPNTGGGIVSTEEATKARIRLYERIETIDGAMAPDLRDCKKDAAYGVSVMRMSGACSRVYKYCNDIVTLCNDYLTKYESATPSNHIKDIKERRDDANRVKSEINR